MACQLYIYKMKQCWYRPALVSVCTQKESLSITASYYIQMSSGQLASLHDASQLHEVTIRQQQSYAESTRMLEVSAACLACSCSLLSYV